MIGDHEFFKIILETAAIIIPGFVWAMKTSREIGELKTEILNIKESLRKGS